MFLFGLVAPLAAGIKREDPTIFVPFSHMSRRLPSLNALQAFEAAGRLGRMTLAAAELSVTHSAVSRQVRHLEEVLGTRLFEGPKNALQMTEAGRLLLDHLTPSLDRIEAGIRAVADEAEGLLDVSCLGTFSARWLLPRLHRFQALHPGIEVRLRAEDHPIDFARDRCEVAIRVTDRPHPPDALVTDIFPEQIGVVLAPRWLESSTLERPEDLGAIPLLHTRTRRHGWSDWLTIVGVDLAHGNGPEFDHFYFMLEAATAGLGAAVAPWPLVLDDVRAGRLVAPFGFVPNGHSYVALRRPRRSRKAAAFCMWLADEGAATPRWEPSIIPRPRSAP
jgi:LysR family glycine cleavage system transcriptional activator